MEKFSTLELIKELIKHNPKLLYRTEVAAGFAQFLKSTEHTILLDFYADAADLWGRRGRKRGCARTDGRGRGRLQGSLRCR